MPFFGVPIRNGLPIGLGSVAGFGVQQFDPSQLFSAGEQGTWYDPSDFSTLFSDTSGTVPVTGIEDVVGYMLDKSGNGNHAIAPIGVGNARPTLRALYNIFTGTATLATQTKTTLAAAYTLSFSGAGSITLSGTATGTFNAGTHSVTCTAGSLTATVSGTVTNADMRLTSDLLKGPAYQGVVTATNYDSSGFLPYLSFGGTQAMSTGSIDFTATDKMTVWAGVTKLATSTAFLVEFSSSDSNNGAFGIGVESAGAEYFFNSRGTTLRQVIVDNAAYAPPATNVATLLGDISAPLLSANLNGVSVGTNTSSQGTGNFGNYPLYIGARNLASLFFNGRLYSLITRGAQSTAAEISATESWVNQRTGAY